MLLSPDAQVLYQRVKQFCLFLLKVRRSKSWTPASGSAFVAFCVRQGEGHESASP